MWNLWHIPKLRIRRKAHVCRLVTSPPFMRMILHKKVEPTKNTAHTRWGCPPHHFAVWVRCMTYHDIIINIYKSPQDTPSVYSSYRPRSSHDISPELASLHLFDIWWANGCHRWIYPEQHTRTNTHTHTNMNCGLKSWLHHPFPSLPEGQLPRSNKRMPINWSCCLARPEQFTSLQ